MSCSGFSGALFGSRKWRRSCCSERLPRLLTLSLLPGRPTRSCTTRKAAHNVFGWLTRRVEGEISFALLFSICYARPIRATGEAEIAVLRHDRLGVRRRFRPRTRPSSARRTITEPDDSDDDSDVGPPPHLRLLTTPKMPLQPTVPMADLPSEPRMIATKPLAHHRKRDKSPLFCLTRARIWATCPRRIATSSRSCTETRSTRSPSRHAPTLSSPPASTAGSSFEKVFVRTSAHFGRIEAIRRLGLSFKHLQRLLRRRIGQAVPRTSGAHHCMELLRRRCFLRHA